MTTENYIDHPTFGLLFHVCLVDDSQEMFATLYAQRLFFLVTSTKEGLKFEPIGRGDARLLLENRMRVLNRAGQRGDYDLLKKTYQQTFQ